MALSNIAREKKSSEGATLTIIMPQVNDKTLRARQSFQNASHLTFEANLTHRSWSHRNIHAEYLYINSQSKLYRIKKQNSKMTRLRLCASYYPATFRANTQIGICNLGFAHRCVLLLWTQMVAPAGGFITTIKLYSFAWFCVCCVSLFVWCFTTTVYRILSAFHLTDVIGHIFFPVPSFIILPTGCRWKQLSKKRKNLKKTQKSWPKMIVSWKFSQCSINH